MSSDAEKPARMSQEEIELFQRAMVLTTARRHDEAQRLLSERLERVPDDANAMMMLGRSHLIQGDPLTAHRILTEALALNSLMSSAHELLSMAESDLGLREAAVASAREAIRLAPAERQSYGALAQAQLGLAQHSSGADRQIAYQAALAAGQQRVHLAPDEAVGRVYISEALAGLGQFRPAAQAMRQAARLDPEDPLKGARVVELRHAAKELKLTHLIAAKDLRARVQPTDRQAEFELLVNVHRLLRRTRWIALLCFVLAVLTSAVVDLAATEGRGGRPAEPREFPVALADRLIGVAWIVVIVGVCVVVTHRRTGGAIWRCGVWALRRSWLVCNAALPALWCVLCAAVLLAVSWERREDAYWLVHLAWPPLLITLLVDHTYMRGRPHTQWY